MTGATTGPPRAQGGGHQRAGSCAEIDAHVALGPQGVQVAALIARCDTLTADGQQTERRSGHRSVPLGTPLGASLGAPLGGTAGAPLCTPPLARAPLGRRSGHRSGRRLGLCCCGT